jgi:cytosine/adenosine deaminase-related metal-dependent hydrolase/ubiquinone/menaquinone biosynthesis C-methylase UbiE
VTTVGATVSPFDLWASVYDQQLNPLLQLEERYLKCILPLAEGLDVLDIGCGTGRWLHALAQQSPHSLTGIDSSPEMLRYANSKLGNSATLHLGDCTYLPVTSSSKNLLLASFVLSYVTDLDALAFECSRVCRDGANLFLTDMHPTTQQSQNWKRSFKYDHASIIIESQAHSLQDILYAFRSRHFDLISLLEPRFGPPEYATLSNSGKHKAVLHLPPIYIAQFRKHQRSPTSAALTPLRLAGAHVTHGAHEHTNVSVEIHDHHIHSLLPSSFTNYEPQPPTIDLSGYLILPGLINSHDHLEFGLYPNLGHGPYDNSAQWATDIHKRDADLIEKHCSVPRNVRLWWGAIRNLLSGVTTVFHHNPLTPELLDPNFPVRVVRNFGWAHSLALDSKLVHKFHSTSPHHPFILHAAEGIDHNSATEIFALDNLQVLDNRTILVHGLALTPQTVDLLNRRGLAVVLCPSSNQFLFQTLPSTKTISALHNVLLGSDSPLTAAGDLLDEVRFAQQTLRLNSEEIFAMLTTRAAHILRLQSGEGLLIPGAIADLIAVKDTQIGPSETLSRLHFSDVELVILGGSVRLVSPNLLPRIPSHLREDLQPIEVEGHLRWIRAPLQKLFSQASNILGPDLRLGGKQIRYAGNL